MFDSLLPFERVRHHSPFLLAPKQPDQYENHQLNTLGSSSSSPDKPKRTEEVMPEPASSCVYSPTLST